MWQGGFTVLRIIKIKRKDKAGESPGSFDTELTLKVVADRQTADKIMAAAVRAPRDETPPGEKA